MKKPAGKIVIAIIVYFAIFLVGASSGLIHPACYAYFGTVAPILFALPYLYIAANIKTFGAAALPVGIVFALSFLVGEGNVSFAIIMIVIIVLAEIIRRACGYDTKRGVRLSFIPVGFSFYAYSSHWWADTPGTIQAAIEEMPAGYADKVASVVANTPMLVVMLVLTIVVAIVAMRLAEKVMKAQAEKLS